jgi:hypothetical protein
MAHGLRFDDKKLLTITQRVLTANLKQDIVSAFQWSGWNPDKRALSRTQVRIAVPTMLDSSSSYSYLTN